MAKQIKKALCIFLSVIMAFSCFAVSAFAYSGYDRNGSSNALSVQAIVAVDKATYSTGDTVTATITLDHPDDTVYGFQGFVAFDGSKLEFQSIAPAGNFSFYDDASAPSADSVLTPDVTSLQNGYSGSYYTASSFATLLGTATFSSLAVLPFSVSNINGVAAAEGTAIVTVTFEAKSAVSATGISLVPSNVYQSSFGYFSCVATIVKNGVIASAYSSIDPSSAFEITGASTDVYYNITFTWHDDSTTVSTKENTMPEAPTVPNYSEGDYDYSFQNWSPTLGVATAATTYIAIYNETFVSASYTEYNAAIAEAIAKRDNGTIWTEESVQALNTELNKDVSGKGRTEQNVVNAQTTAINNAAAALQEKAATYTVTFQNYDGTVLATYTDLEAGAAVSYTGATPEREGNAQYTYTFSGWDPAVVPVAGNATYTAQFTQSVNEYTITFKNEDGSVLQTGKVAYGEVPAYTGATPEKASTAQYSYVFNGWNPSVTPVSGDAEYVATFKQTEKTYLVKFVDEDGTILQSDRLTYGATITPPADPTKAADNTYTYTFAGWNPSPAATVTEDVTYTATYTEKFIDYYVYFVNEDDSEIETLKLHYNDTITQPADPSKAANETYTYTFAGWSPAVPEKVTENNVTYKATFTPKYIDYSIKFTWHDGEQTVTAHYGDTVNAPTVPTYQEGGKNYSFAGWSPTLTICQGPAEYEATYSDSYIVYNITFVVGDEEYSRPTNAGFMPAAPEVQDYEDGDYDVTFLGWDSTVVPAAGDATYTAQFERTFVNADYKDVEAAQLQAADITKANYTDETVAVLNAALDAVQTGLGRTQQGQVNAWAADIVSAISGLKLKDADYTAYNAAVAALETELAKEDYTPESIEAVRQQLAEINNGLDKDLDITQQGKVDTAEQAVIALNANLVEKADKGELKSLIDQANALDSDKYVDFTEVTAKLNAAQEVYDNANASTAAVAAAIRELRSAMSTLVKKDADYSAWNALVNQYNDIEKQYYTADSLAAVDAVLAQIQEGQNIDYQPTLDALVADLDEAIRALDILSNWEGETDFYGVDHEWFHANLEFEKVEDETNPSKVAIRVYLNHPLNTVTGIQVAALYDASLAELDYVEINGGTLIGSNSGEAPFNPTDYGYGSLGTADIVKFIAEFDSPLAQTTASRDLIATIHLNAIGTGSSYVKAVPLASNIYADKTTYSAFWDELGNEHFMHSDWITADFTGSINGLDKIASDDNTKAQITVSLMSGEDTVKDEVSGKVEDGFYFSAVEPGTYTVKLSAPGSLGFTIYNVKVEAGEEFVMPEVKLLFGDCNESGTINIDDIAHLITLLGTRTPSCDVNGSGTVTVDDIPIIFYSDHYGKSARAQTTTL